MSGDSFSAPMRHPSPRFKGFNDRRNTLSIPGAAAVSKMDRSTE
jgi:hypothetical protein